MVWKNILYTLIIALLYIPMVFLGATTFFPDNGQDWFVDPVSCYDKVGAYPSPEASEQDIADWEAVNERCQAENREAREVWDSERDRLEGMRYIFIAVMNLIVLGIAAFVTVLTAPVATGLFAGSTIATFVATLSYFDSASQVGFGLLVLLFVIVVYFITRQTRTAKSKSKKRK